MAGCYSAVMHEATRIEYPHITMDPAVAGGQPCIAETGVRVTLLAAAYENGQKAVTLQESFRRRGDEATDSIRPLTLPEVFAGLAYYYDNIKALELVRVEDERLADVATKDRHDAILKHYLGK